MSAERRRARSTSRDTSQPAWRAHRAPHLRSPLLSVQPSTVLTLPSERLPLDTTCRRTHGAYGGHQYSRGASDAWLLCDHRAFACRPRQVFCLVTTCLGMPPLSAIWCKIRFESSEFTVMRHRGLRCVPASRRAQRVGLHALPTPVVVVAPLKACSEARDERARCCGRTHPVSDACRLQCSIVGCIPSVHGGGPVGGRGRVRDAECAHGALCCDTLYTRARTPARAHAHAKRRPLHAGRRAPSSRTSLAFYSCT